MNPLEWIQLSPTDDTPAAMKRWCQRHAALVACILFALVFFIIPAMLWAVPRMGSLAWAGDVDTKIEAAIGPIRRDIENIKNKDIQEIKDAVARSNATANDIKASLLGQSILNARRAQCDAINGGTPARFWADRVLELRDQYRRLTGEGFEMPASCAEL